MRRLISNIPFEDKTKPFALFVSMKFVKNEGQLINEGVILTEEIYNNSNYKWGFQFVKQFSTEQEASSYYRMLYELSQKGDILSCPKCGSIKVYTWGRIHLANPKQIGKNVDCHYGHGSCITNEYIDKHNIFIWDEERKDFATGLVSRGY
ncbi:hypothetical protein ABWK22_01675 [Gottfriedia acidiceleris]|uniref:hypothetical protein n=1 Tax=Gottfriedia acidiceleris TaxID=371036 RepID=UPI003391F73B